MPLSAGEHVLATFATLADAAELGLFGSEALPLSANFWG
jgi:hypothetical protein